MSSATEYARAVLAGEIVAGDSIKAACERHLDDLKHAAERGLYFDPEAATRATGFFCFLHHSKGEWAGQPLELEPWQRFIIESLFGWHRADGSRRFRTAYIEVARKNGKSTLAAGLGLYMLVADEEPGAEVYSAATSREQAKIVFDEAARMRGRSRFLARRVTAFRNNLHIRGTAAKFQPLSSDYNKLDGLNAHCVIVDELHAHPNRDVFDVLETSTGSRRQPLIFGITTAGQEATSFCGQMHDYADAVARRALEDDAFFAFIATLDKGDDWTDPAVWAKANPNLGISVKVETLAEQCRKAENDTSAQNGFRRLRLNQWLAASERYVDLAVWDRSAGELEPAELEVELEGRVAYGGLDLASHTDLAALELVFPSDEPAEPWGIVSRFFMPEDRARDPEARRRDRVPYDAWVDAGWIIATPGAVIDFAAIRLELEELAERYTIAQVGFDPWNATGLVTELEEDAGFVMVPIRQGFASLNSPTKVFAARVASAGFRHGGHPVLRWQIDNLAVRRDPAGNVKPDKEKSRQRIDGAVALIMAVDRADRNEGADPGSVYATGGILTL